MLKTWVLKLKEEVAFLEMSILYTTNAFATQFIKNTHLRNNLSKQTQYVRSHYASFLFISVPYLLLFIYFLLLLLFLVFFGVCKLSKYCNQLQNFQVLANVFFFFLNSVKVCYKEWYFKKNAKNFVIQLATFGISNKNHHYSNPSSSIVTIEFIIIRKLFYKITK